MAILTPRGFRREVLIVPSKFCNFKIPAIISSVRAAELDLRGWPVLYLDRANIHSDDTGVFCKVPPAKGERLFLYWMIAPDGLARQLSMCSETWHEALRSDNLFDPVIRVFELAETIAVFLRFYQLMGVDDGITLDMHFSWPESRKRLIAYHANPMSVSFAEAANRTVPIDTPRCTVQVPTATTLDQIPTLIVDPWRELISQVTESFADVTDSTITTWAQKVLTRQPLQ